MSKCCVVISLQFTKYNVDFRTCLCQENKLLTGQLTSSFFILAIHDILFYIYKDTAVQIHNTKFSCCYFNQPYLGVDVGCTRRRQRTKLARAHRLRDGNGGRQHAPGRLPDGALEFGIFVEGMLLVVTEYFEDDGVGFYIVHERF